MADHLFRFNLLADVLVNAAAAVETSACHLVRCDRPEGLQLKAASAAGTASVKVEMATSPDGTAWDSYDDRPDIIADNTTDFPNNQEGWNVATMPNPLNPFVKFKVTGLAANPADTLVSVGLLARELV